MQETSELGARSTEDISAHAAQLTNPRRSAALAQQQSLTEGYSPRAEDMSSFISGQPAEKALPKGSTHKSEKKLVRRGSKKTGVNSSTYIKRIALTVKTLTHILQYQPKQESTTQLKASSAQQTSTKESIQQVEKNVAEKRSQKTGVRYFM